MLRVDLALAIVLSGCARAPEAQVDAPTWSRPLSADSGNIDSGDADTAAGDSGEADTGEAPDSGETGDTTDSVPTALYTPPLQDLTDETCTERQVEYYFSCDGYCSDTWGTWRFVEDDQGQERWNTATVPSTWSFYDEARRLEAVYQYDGADPATVAYARLYTYDPEGRPLTARTDTLGDGTVDEACDWTWGPDGYTQTCDEWAADGALSRRTVSSGGLDGVATYIGTDWDGDGVLDAEDTYTYDASGKLLDKEERRAGVVTAVETYTYDASGVLSAAARDSETSGWTRSYTYDDAGQLVEDLTTYAATGRVARTVYAWDELGRFLGWSLDSTNDGTSESYERAGYGEVPC